MFAKWSISYKENATLKGLGQNDLISQSLEAYKADSRTELRDSQGHTIRMAKGSEFKIIDDANGNTAETYGEVFLKNITPMGDYKYRTSCYTSANIANTITDLFIKNITETQDDFLLLSGCLSIYEFDENNRPFVICSLSQGEKATMYFDPDAPKMRKRYSAEISEISNEEYDYITKNYLDPRKWQ